MSEETDIHAKEISESLSMLHDLIDTPVANHALELTKNAPAAEEYDILRRLQKSLKQYLERGGSLFYVGILGHFSAGKSSTINSLLDVWSTKDERRTSLNPTDTTITLITREKNAESLIGVIREGHVPIRLQTVESAVLDQLVLADTPGTGDPQFIEEVARDFLPICDVILFVLSAASPLDKSDVPLLVELHKRLPFIPLYFVVTRADELRSDSNAPVSEQNIDQEKLDQFMQSLVVRVNALLSPQIYMQSNFMLVDNRTKFRIEQLGDFLSAKFDLTSPQAHISMHMNKLHYFVTEARRLKDFFAGILDKKLMELNKIVNAAERNIERYQQNVKISNSNLTKTWIEFSATISKTCSQVSEIFKNLMSIPPSIGGLAFVSYKRTETRKDLVQDAKFHAGSTAVAVRSQVQAVLRDHFYSIQRAIHETSLTELSAARNGVTSVTIPLEVRNIHFSSTSALSKRRDELFDAEISALRGAASDLRSSVKDLDNLLIQRRPLIEIENVIESARESLRGDLNQFFQNVELYRSGVFSHTTKESIATLGIGQRLDALEEEFTETDRLIFTSEAVEEFFLDSKKLFNEAAAKLATLAQRTGGLTEEAKALRIESPETPLEPAQGALLSARATLQAEIRDQVQADVDRLCANANLHVSNLIVDAKNKFDMAMQTVMVARRRRYGTAFCVTAILFVTGYLGYRHYHRQPAPASVLGEACLSILCGLMVEIIVFAAIRLRENLPKMIAKNREQVHTALNEDVRKAMDLALSEYRFDSLNEITLNSRLLRIYEQALVVDTEEWDIRINEILQQIRRLLGTYTGLRSEYLTLVDNIRQQSIKYFADEIQNLTVLDQVGLRIKERAIEPSFALLAETRAELLSVKTQVEGVQFG